MLQIYSRVYQCNLKTTTNFLAYTKQDTPNLDKPLPLNSFVLHRKFITAEFSVKLKPLRHAPFKIIDKSTDDTYELLLQKGKNN